MSVARHAQIIQNNKFTISLQYLKKKVWWSWFLHANKHESLLQIDTMILIGMVKHSQSSQNSKLAMSLQYLKKELRGEVDFLHLDKHQSFNKLALSFLMELVKLVQSTQNRNSVIFLKYTKKKKSDKYFCFLLWCKTFRYFMGSSHVRCYLLFIKSEKFFKFKLYNSSVDLL